MGSRKPSKKHTPSERRMRAVIVDDQGQRFRCTTLTDARPERPIASPLRRVSPLSLREHRHLGWVRDVENPLPPAGTVFDLLREEAERAE